VAVSLLHTAPFLRRARWAIVLLGAALLLGCARGDTRAHNPARSALRAAAQPVLMTVLGNPFAMEQARLNALVSTELGSGVTGMNRQFTTSPERAAAPDPRVVVALNTQRDPDPATLCAAPDGIATGPATGQLQIVAAFCRVNQVLGATRTEGAASGPTDQRFRRLLWRTGSTLFPDDYEQTYGLGILPRGLDFGSIGGSIGGD
jgi:hypothetical protein